MPANGNPEQGDYEFLPIPVLHGLDFMSILNKTKILFSVFKMRFMKLDLDARPLFRLFIDNQVLPFKFYFETTLGT